MDKVNYRMNSSFHAQRLPEFLFFNDFLLYKFFFEFFHLYLSVVNSSVQSEKSQASTVQGETWNLGVRRVKNPLWKLKLETWEKEESSIQSARWNWKSEIKKSQESTLQGKTWNLRVIRVKNPQWKLKLKPWEYEESTFSLLGETGSLKLRKVRNPLSKMKIET